MADPTGGWAMQPPLVGPAAMGDGHTPYLFVDSFPHALACLNVNDITADAGTLFESYQEALDWRSNLARSQLNNDPTIPHSTLQKKILTKTLFVAFKSIARAEDNEPMIKPFRDERHDNGRVEVLCWQLLEACIRRAEAGPLLFSWDPIRTRYNSPLNTFAERFDEMVKSIATSKTICKHLYDAPYANHFVDDPLNARKRVLSNRALNKRKGAMMAQGRNLKRIQEAGVVGAGSNQVTTGVAFGSAGNDDGATTLDVAQGGTPTVNRYNGANDSFTTPTRNSFAIGQGFVPQSSVYTSPYNSYNQTFSAPQPFHTANAYATPTASSVTGSRTSLTPVNSSIATSTSNDLQDSFAGFTPFTSGAELPATTAASLSPASIQLPFLTRPFTYNVDTAAAPSNNFIFGSGAQFPNYPQTESTTPLSTPPSGIQTRSAASTYYTTSSRAESHDPHMTSDTSQGDTTPSDEDKDDDPDWKPEDSRGGKKRRH